LKEENIYIILLLSTKVFKKNTDCFH